MTIELKQGEFVFITNDQTGEIQTIHGKFDPCRTHGIEIPEGWSIWRNPAIRTTYGYKNQKVCT